MSLPKETMIEPYPVKPLVFPPPTLWEAFHGTVLASADYAVTP